MCLHPQTSIPSYEEACYFGKLLFKKLFSLTFTEEEKVARPGIWYWKWIVLLVCLLVHLRIIYKTMAFWMILFFIVSPSMLEIHEETYCLLSTVMPHAPHFLPSSSVSSSQPLFLVLSIILDPPSWKDQGFGSRFSFLQDFKSPKLFFQPYYLSWTPALYIQIITWHLHGGF